MNKTENAPARYVAVRVVVLLGLFAGTAAGAGFLLAGIPNVELMSLVVAVAGVVLGARLGAVCGALAAGIYSLGSPFGIPAVWILVAQMAGLAGLGLLGGLWSSWNALSGSGLGRRVLGSLFLALIGTTWYEAVTTAGVMAGFNLEPAVVLAGAVPFYLLHTGSNLVIFAALFPSLAGRFRHLGREPLVGRVGSVAPLVLLGWMCLAAPGVRADAGAPADSTLAVAVQAPAPPARVEGPPEWRRGLWHPFSASLLDLLAWHGDFVPVADGGLGSAAMILGEFSTAAYPLVMRRGLPLGTGHVLADDPGLVPLAGMRPDTMSFGLDPWGGTGGWIQLARRDQAPQDAFTSYEGTKGRHETYGRKLQLLTPQAPWRLGFEYQENLDKEGYNFSDLPGEVFDPIPDDEYYPGHARLRQSHVRLSRTLTDQARLDIDYDYARKTKDLVPALDADHQEVWSDGVSVDMHGGSRRVGVRTAVFWRNRDVRMDQYTAGSDTASRMLSTGRQGLLLEVTLGRRNVAANSAPADLPVSGVEDDSLTAAVPDSGEAAAAADSSAASSVDSLESTSADSTAAAPADSTVPGTSVERPDTSGGSMLPVQLSMSVENWTLDDTGPDTLGLGHEAGPVHMDGQQAVVTVGSGLRVFGLQMTGRAGGLWTDRLGWDQLASARLRGHGGPVRWGLYYEAGGRAPRSDELGTVLRHGVADRVLILEPNSGLKREKTRRWGLRLASRLVGMDLAAEGVSGSVEDGITWVPSAPGSESGRLANGVAMDYTRLTAAVGHQGRFLGWGRIRYEGTWQDFSSTGLQPAFMPPDTYTRLTVMWENHLFAEDAVLEVALFRTHVGAMSDPWDVTGSYGIPARTLTDLVVGFRLVGADLSLALRNLTGERYRLTGNAWGPGRETVMRLSWNFLH